MKKDEYGELIDRLTSLDTSTLTRIEAELTRLLTFRATAAALAVAQTTQPTKSDHYTGVATEISRPYKDPASSRPIWTEVENTLPGARIPGARLSITEREKDPKSARLSWAEMEKRLDQERR
ncbi:MAG: hypothetical protein LBS60_15235 [Deltaproteobacteria bacterium]|jgi:hypothetical protein|nr:hypothetical protein [Deltaproteobacteria bacterium]